ncbi:hypothetical protein SCB49_07682 [unidentified eubacterium SCB49]|nr:hypothetical protein SCB49_07682 [unidentified eubacterium SCB49]
MNKKNTYLGTAIVILIFAIIFVPKIHDRIVNGNTVDSNRSSDSLNESKGLTGRSIGDMTTFNVVPEFSFTNQNNDTITNADYKNKVYVVEFFFSTCPSICPIMNANMQQVQDAFAEREDFGIASFSIDPTYDTPEVLKEYADSYDVTHPHWNFLTGDKTDIMKLSNEGFKLFAAENPEAEGGFEHSGMFALIDKDGNVTSRIDENGNPLIYYNGLEQEGIDMLIEDIKKIL